MKTQRVLCLSLVLIVNNVLCEQLRDSERPAEFKSLPTTIKTFENDTVTLPCHLENAGINYYVRWIKDKVVIADSSVTSDLIPPPRIRFFANHSLQVSRLISSDTGEYVCEVIREKPWSPLRQIHDIEVNYPPSVVSVPEIGIVEVRLNEEVDIGCKASGTPTPFITWTSKGDPLELIDNRSRLKFKATNRHLAGTFECIADNGVGEPARASIQVIILHPPEMSTDTSWVHTSPGLRSQLECKVAATPSAKVQWFHGHNPVNLGSRIVAHSHDDKYILIFRNVITADLGQYTCKAENKIGMAELKMHLSGVANAAVFKTDHISNRQTPTAFTLIWEVDSYSPVFEYNLWFRPYKAKSQQPEGVYIKDKEDTWIKITIPGENDDGPVHTTSYALKGLTPSTVYEAIVTSRNRFGWSKPSEILHFATSSGVMRETRPTDETNYSPIIEDAADYKSVSNIYATAASASTKDSGAGYNSTDTIKINYLLYVFNFLLIRYFVNL